MTKTVTAQPDVEPTEEEPEEDYVPVPKDFKIKIKIREKTCFGSAGCNVVYQIDPQYVGRDGGMDPDASYELTYRVTGGDSGPIINTFNIDAGQASFDEEEYASTPSQSTPLRAVVTEVAQLD